MLRLMLREGGKVVAVAGAAVVGNIARWIKNHPKMTAATTVYVIDAVMSWIWDALFRAPDADIEQLVSKLRENIHSVSWSSNKSDLIKQLEEYAGRGSAERAAIVKTLSEAGFRIQLPPEVLSSLEVEDLSPHDAVLIGEFGSTMESKGMLNKMKTGTNECFKVELDRIALLDSAAHLVGGRRNWLILHLSHKVLDETDVEAAELAELKLGYRR